jgi:hypothetical protein
MMAIDAWATLWLLAQQDPLRVQVADGTSASDWIALALTFALVLVTIWYAIQTRNTVIEMRTARAADVEFRQREKSDRAAYRCLVAVRDLYDSMAQRGASAVERETLSAVRDVLDGEGILIHDADVRDRLSACSQALFVGGYTTEAMMREGLAPGRVMLAVQEFVRATRIVLEGYLAERPHDVDPWQRSNSDGFGGVLPSSTEVMAWVHHVSKSS